MIAIVDEKMKKFKSGRHIEYLKIHEKTHSGQSVSGLKWAEERNNLIQIIG